MRIIDDDLPKEAAFLKAQIESIFGLEVILAQEGDPGTKRGRVLRIIREEIYIIGQHVHVEDEDDDWAFGYAEGMRAYMSIARLKCKNKEQYYKRLLAIAVHEIGHTFSVPTHYEKAYWVNAETGHKQYLGYHCDNPRCIMYEIVDLETPEKKHGHLLIGKKKRYDAGLDELIERRYKRWFCDKCKRVQVAERQTRQP